MDKTKFLEIIDKHCRTNANADLNEECFSNPLFIHRYNQPIDSFEAAAEAFSKVHGINIKSEDIQYAYPIAQYRQGSDD